MLYFALILRGYLNLKKLLIPSFSSPRLLHSPAHYVKLFFRPTPSPLSSTFYYPLTLHPTCAYQRVRNVSFSKNFGYVLNGWPLSNYVISVLIIRCSITRHIVFVVKIKFQHVTRGLHIYSFGNF